MDTVLVRSWVEQRGTTLARQLDPRRSITGKLAVVGVAMALLTTVLVATAIWQLTTRFVTTFEGAQVVYRGGVLTLVVLLAGQVVTLAVVRQSVVGGLRELDGWTRTIVEKGTHGTEFSTTRRDEIGQLSWRVAELRDELATQVETVESLNRELATVATSQSQTLAACRRGDLTRRMETETGIPQFEALATNFNAMMDETETMVAEIRTYSQRLTAAAAETTDHAGQVHQSAMAVTDSTASISDGVDRQHSRLEGTAEAMETLADSVDAIAAETVTVARRSERAASTTREGAAAAEDALEQLTEIRARTDRSVEEMEALSELVGEIGEITDLISEMTRRTSHLANNTQIEASRDGDGEISKRLTRQIKKLAADTDGAATDIERIVDGIESQTAAAVSEITETRAAIERSAEPIEGALGALEDVESVVRATSNEIDAIDEATDTQAARTVDVLESVEAIREISAETATEASTAARAAAEQQTIADEIQNRLDWLSSTATDLERRLEQFTVRESSVSRGPSRGATQ
ncbi:methyl-accepting chemotaxis protein [Natrinema salinisoli]|uniref:methyl-accepting chemotaxis protein n=1 Tax=Natrinema salinisoli TaxID=2878535 RepID=UPI001CF0006F|nr:methyl-accepting chemotaxis protein [Natrinema salinisoli]